METDFKEVQTNQPSEPLFLVRGLEELQRGKVGAIIHDGEFIYPGHMKVFRYLLDFYTLAAVGEAIQRRPLEVGLSKYKLMLWASGRSQTLVESAVGFDDALPRVIWAGDLDRDGKIDLFMDTALHYQITEYSLFLFPVFPINRSFSCRAPSEPHPEPGDRRSGDSRSSPRPPLPWPCASEPGSAAAS